MIDLVFQLKVRYKLFQIWMTVLKFDKCFVEWFGR